MEVKGQLISAPDPPTCPGRKQQERMAELQERRRSLQALLSARLAELRHICLQEAELTGAVSRDFPLEAGENPPCVRRRGGASRQPNRKCRTEEESDLQRSKPKKTLFSAALRKHSDPEHSTHTHTHSQHGKRTVHRGCHTDDMVRSESSSMSDSTGQDIDDSAAHCRPPLVSAGSPVFCQSKTRRNSALSRSDHLESLQTHRPLPLHPPPPSRSQDSSPSDPGGEAGGRLNAARHSNSSDGLLDRVLPLVEENLQQGALWVAGLPGSRLVTRTKAGVSEGGGADRGAGGRGGGYSEVLLDYVWGKQQHLQRQQSQPAQREPIISPQQSSGAPPTCRGHPGNQQRIKVTRTKSCGPFLPGQQNQTDTHNPPLSAIQPDPHPHLLPPRPPHPPSTQDAQLEDATRSLHKALALEGLRDWYLRNTIGSAHQSQANGTFNAGLGTKLNGEVKGQTRRGEAPRGRRKTTHGVIQQSTYQTEGSVHPVAAHHKPALPHSATFHGHPLHGRSADGSLYHESFSPQSKDAVVRELAMDHPSPGTLV
ncbi:uncharacterized protein V6R79_006937 [Siganus canaliculatus]